MPGAIFIDKDGKEVFLHEDEYQAGIAAGLKPKDATLPGTTLLGQTTVAPEAYQGLAFKPNIESLSPEERQKYWEDQAFQAKYGGTGNAIASGIEGALGTLTLGGSELVERGLGMDVRERARAHPLAHTIGSIGGALATLPFGGEGLAGLAAETPLGLAANAARQLGGLKGMAAEGAVFGFGQGVSNLALSNEPLTAEAAVSELASSTAGGGLIGLGGGLAGKAIGSVAGKVGKVAEKLQSKQKLAEAANSVLDLSSEESTHWARQLRSASGASDDFVAALPKAEKTIAEATEALPTDFTHREILAAEKSNRGMLHDVSDYLGGQAELGVPGTGNLQGKLKTVIRNLEDDLNSLEGAGKLDKLGRVTSRQAGEEAWAESVIAGPDKKKYAEIVQKMRDKAMEYGEKAGFPQTGRWAERMNQPWTGIVDESVGSVGNAMVRDGDPMYRITEYLKNPKGAEALSAAPGVLEAPGAAASTKDLQKAYRRAWGLGSSDTLSAESLNSLANAPLPDALHKLETMSAYHDALRQAGAGKVVDQVQETLARMGENNPAWKGVDPADLLQKLGFKEPERIQALAQAQPDLLKFWLAKQSLKQAAAAEGSDRFGGWIGRMMFRRAGGLLGAAVAGQPGYLGGELAAQSLMNSSSLAAAAGKTTARIASALDKLAKGVAKPAIQRSALDVLNALNPEDKGKDLHEAFRKRSAEIARLAANPETQYNLAHAMETSGVTHASLGVADKAIVHADRALKYLNAQAPKDNGQIQTLGRSRWRATEGDLNKWANMARAVLDPVSVIEGAANGTVTPAAVHALKETAPATFEEFQRQLIHRLPEIQKNATYDQQIRLGILFEVPVNSVTRPDFQQFIQQTWAEKPQPMKIEANTMPEPQTKAQQLLSL